MFRLLRRLSEKKVAALEQQLEAYLAADESINAGRTLKPLLDVQKDDQALALRLVGMVRQQRLPPEQGLEVLKAVALAHGREASLMASTGAATQGARDIDYLNLAAPEDSFFVELLGTLETHTAEHRGSKLEIELQEAIATTARMCARQHGDVAEAAHRRILELAPDNYSNHYNYGLFLKTRGRFAEGMTANQRAAALGGGDSEAVQWNLGICATGAGDARVALAVWKGMQNKIAMGRFDLPEGGYPPCKVRLAERPLAERGALNDDPGLEETIWIERLSPCHGVIRSVLVQDLGVDYGDAVLIDGAPITYHRSGDRDVPVFPHLATLRRNAYAIFDFAGRQAEAGQLEAFSDSLPADSVIYSHTENYRLLCRECWSDPDSPHEHDENEQSHIVEGRIAVPPSVDLDEVVRRLQAALDAAGDAELYAPEIWRALGQADRAVFEERRMALLKESALA